MNGESLGLDRRRAETVEQAEELGLLSTSRSRDVLIENVQPKYVQIEYVQIEYVQIESV